MTQRALDATLRYQRFLDQLRAQFEIALRNDPNHGSTRLEATDAGKELARAWLADELEVIRIDSYAFGREGYADAAAGNEPPTEVLAHFGNTSQYLLETLAAQAARDIATMTRTINTAGMRIDMGLRSGRRDAAAAVLLDPATAVRFTFVDRAGRVYSSDKHVRDQYRHQLLHARNDGFLYAAAERGIDQVEILNPSVQNQWNGTIVGVHDGEGEGVSYYDIRDEVFHPSSESYLALPET